MTDNNIWCPKQKLVQWACFQEAATIKKQGGQ
jgi:hypothetical protein